MKKIKLKTDGKGLWSNTATDVTVVDFNVNRIVEKNGHYFGELCVYFDTKTWPESFGLIYTDKKFLKELRLAFVNVFGLSRTAVNDIDYSEQGMQGTDYVSLNYGSFFIKEYFEKIYKPSKRSKLNE